MGACSLASSDGSLQFLPCCKPRPQEHQSRGVRASPVFLTHLAVEISLPKVSCLLLSSLLEGSRVLGEILGTCSHSCELSSSCHCSCSVIAIVVLSSMWKCWLGTKSAVSIWVRSSQACSSWEDVLELLCVLLPCTLWGCPAAGAPLAATGCSKSVKWAVCAAGLCVQLCTGCGWLFRDPRALHAAQGCSLHKHQQHSYPAETFHTMNVIKWTETGSQQSVSMAAHTFGSSHVAEVATAF